MFECCCCCVDFFPFGRGVGDTLGPHEDDAVAGPLNLNVPVMYFGRQHTRLYVRCMGLLLALIFATVI